MGLLNVAVTRLLAATPVTTGVVASGEVAVTVGATLAPGVPRIGSRPEPPQPAKKAGSNATTKAVRKLKKLLKGFMGTFLRGLRIAR